MRQYLHKLGDDPWEGEDGHGLAPLWHGLANCTGNWNMLTIAREIIGHMWS